MRVIHLLFSLTVLLASGQAWSAEAQRFLKGKHAELAALVQKDEKAKLDKAFDQVLDYEALAKDSLAGSWDKKTPAEREEFQKLLTELVRGAYKKNLKRTLGYAIEYRGETKIERGVLVKTVAKNAKNAREEPISIDYAMHLVGSRWKVRDIVTDGSSLVSNYKNQFRRIEKQHGFAELLRRMRSKVEQGEAD